MKKRIKASSKQPAFASRNPETLSKPSTKHSISEKHQITFIDLFAGIGGFRRGFESIGAKCIFTSEYDKFSRETYTANFDINHEFAGDIEEVAERDIPAHDVLLAGFPCQPFSIAGVSKKNSLGREHGFQCQTQGTLFFHIERILEHHQPAMFVLENVKNIVSHDSRRTFKTIRHVLEKKLGYVVDYPILDAQAFVPQHRERIYMIGFKSDVGFWAERDLRLPALDMGPALGTILHPEDGSEAPEEPYTVGSEGRVNDKYTLSDRLWEYLQGYAAKHKAKGNGFGFGLFGPDDIARTLSARYYKDGSEILIKQDGKNPRRLTPRECARLMGFDRKGQAPVIIPVSDTQAYKQFGNAVVVPMVEEIGRTVQPFLRKLLTGRTKQKEGITQTANA